MRQRIELTSTVRASTTGMLYVLDEPSVGLHPSNVLGLRTTITALAGNGNSVVVVEHERELIRSADWVIELGPAGRGGETGGRRACPGSVTGPWLGEHLGLLRPEPRCSLSSPRPPRQRPSPEKMFRKNRNTFSTSRKIDAASSGAAVMSVLVRSRWKSNMVNPAKITRPSTE